MLRHLGSGLEEVGFYSAGSRLLEGLIFMHLPFATVLFREMRMRADHPNDFIPYILKIFISSIVSPIVIIPTGWFFSKEILNLCYGASFIDASPLFNLLLISFFFMILNLVLTQATLAVNREVFYAKITCVAALANIMLNFYLIPAMGAKGAAIGTIITEGLVMILIGAGIILWRRKLALKAMKGTLTQLFYMMRLHSKGEENALCHLLCRDLGADLAFGYRNKKTFNLDELSNKLINLESESNLPAWRTIKRLHAFLNKTKFLNKYENVIYTGQNSSLAVSNHSEGKNIYYCFTPPRSIYDLKESYLASQTPLERLRHVLYNAFYQPLYENAIRKMDVILSDSKNVQNRIHKFLGLESTVIYPPCDVDKFCWVSQGDYYLSTARLTPQKRLDIIIQAFI